MPRELTKEIFINREPDLLSGEYEFIGRYMGCDVKTLFKHNKCGYEWKFRPRNFHDGKRCPRCAGVERLDTETFIEREKDIQSGEYEILEEYKNARTKILFKHVVCGYEWKTTTNNFHAGSRCPRCKSNRTHIKKFNK